VEDTVSSGISVAFHRICFLIRFQADVFDNIAGEGSRQMLLKDAAGEGS
jgi:hypothetical protein